MKKYIVLFSMMLSGLVSCSYLDIVPDDTPTLDDAFKNENTAEGFVFGCYGFMPNYANVRTENIAWLTSNEFVASYHWSSDYYVNIRLQTALYNSTDPGIDLWRKMYQGIRQCYIFMNNVEKVVPVTMSQTEFEAKKKTWLAEMKFLIAYYHYVLLQNYGPVCLVENEISIEGSTDEMFLSRRPVDECVEWIAHLFDEAIVDLPTTVPSSDYGRATKVVAQSLKSQMYLFAASPLFNGNSEFYSDFKNKDGELLVNQTYDKEKWKVAMDESLKAIEMAEEAGHKLYQYQGDEVLSDFDQAIANTRYTMLDRWNSELIWGYTGKKESNITDSYQNLVTPQVLRDGATPPYGGIGPTLTAVEMFYSEKGIPLDQDPSFDWDNRFKIAEGDSTIQLHRNREPRFYACIGYDRGPYEINEDTLTLYMKYGEKFGCKNLNQDHFYGGYAVKKGLNPVNKVTNTTYSKELYPIPLIRLAELYLNYVEACAEYTGSLEDKALGYMNAIRRKAGIPDFEKAYGNLTGDRLIEAIHHERMIEFIFESHWYYDLRRWKKAEEFYAPDANGMRGLYALGETNEDFYQEYRLPGRPYVFTRKQYLHPINNVDITVNNKLVQNPGW